MLISVVGVLLLLLLLLLMVFIVVILSVVGLALGLVVSKFRLLVGVIVLGVLHLG